MLLKKSFILSLFMGAPFPAAFRANPLRHLSSDFLSKHKSIPLKCLLLLLVVFVSVESYGQDGVMRVHVINIGQGSATLIEFPCGVMLVDTGGENNIDFESTDGLLTYLDDFFQRRSDLNNTIDLMVISHPHIDHTRGIKKVLEHYSIKNVITNGQVEQGSGVAQQKALQKFISDRELTPSTEDDIGFFESRISKIPAGGITDTIIDPIGCPGADPTIKVLWGTVATDPGWGKDESGRLNFNDQNNHSVVMKIEFGNASMFLTGDLEEVAIESMLQKHANPQVFDSDVYLVGHHGSKNGTTTSLLQAVSPEIAILSFGDPARQLAHTAWDYGHPNQGIINSLIAAVSGTRTPITVPVGIKKQKFTTKTISKAVYGVGWDDTIVLTASLNGTWQVGADVDDRININSATLAELKDLPAIGPAKAQAIIDFRNGHPFTSVDDLNLVPGIGPATVTLLRPFVRV